MKFLQFLGMTDVEELTSLYELRKRLDRFLLGLILLHFPITLLLTLGYGTWMIALVFGAALTLISAIAYFAFKGTLFLRVLNGIVLMAYSALMIQIQLGRIEMHFHIFGALAFLVVYRDYKPILPAALVIAIHHGAFNYCQENSILIGGVQPMVFNYGNGWDIVLLHAGFVVFEAIILLYIGWSLERQFLFQSRTIALLNARKKEKEELVTELEQTTGTLLEGSDSIRSVIESMNGSVQEESAALEEMNAGMEDILGSLDRVAHNSDEAVRSLSQMQEETRELSAGTNQLVSQIKETNGLINASVKHTYDGRMEMQEMSAFMKSMGQRAEQTLKIIHLIDGIAEQVNMLSLNASIEAARAGEAGRGFSVVAEEIAQLADKTADSSKKISDLLKETGQQVVTGQSVVSKNVQIMESLAGEIEQVSSLMDRMTGALNGQMNSFKAMSESINVTVHQSMSTDNAVKELNSNIGEIKESIQSVSALSENGVEFAAQLTTIGSRNRDIAQNISRQTVSLKSSSLDSELMRLNSNGE